MFSRVEPSDPDGEGVLGTSCLNSGAKGPSKMGGQSLYSDPHHKKLRVSWLHGLYMFIIDAFAFKTLIKASLKSAKRICIEVGLLLIRPTC
jgi:hypothetical protein